MQQGRTILEDRGKGPARAAPGSALRLPETDIGRGRRPERREESRPGRSPSLLPHEPVGEPPAETRSFVLIVDDPDAPGGVFTHWVLFNLPVGSRELPEAVPTQAQLPNGSLQGKNDFGGIGYGGPCPPPGRPHRYQFALYALDQPLDLKAGASKKQVIGAMQGHILAQGQLTGTYQR